METEMQKEKEPYVRVIRPLARMPPNYTFTPGEYNPPDAFYCEVPLEEGEAPLMGAVIGSEGYYFKAITSATNVYYIWFAKDRGVVEIWGPESRLPLAIERVRERIERVKEQRAERKRLGIEKALARAAAAAAAAAIEDSATILAE